MLGPLIPKLRGYFAEFLNESYLEHLRIFSPRTCVGLSTVGKLHHLEVLSRRLTRTASLPRKKDRSQPGATR